MKRIKGDDSTAKAYRERYARILELDEIPADTAAKKGPLRWYLLLLALSAGAFGVWFFVKAPTAGTASPAPAPATSSLHQPQPDSELSALPVSPEAGQPEPGAAEAAASPDQAGETAAPDVTAGAKASIQPPFAEAFPQSNAETAPQSGVPGSSLVVLLSTTSKEGAIARAKELNSSGVLSEVILSTSGYYGVVLRRDTYDQAIASMNALIASGTVKNKPYIMSANRVKERVYPEAASSGFVR